MAPPHNKPLDVSRSSENLATDAERVENRVNEARNYLLERAASVDLVLNEFWEAKRSEWHALPGIIQDLIDVYAELTSGGKKMRAVLAVLAYETCRHDASPSPHKDNGLQRAAGAIEILHNASLIHDDIVDRSELRRGATTVHRRFGARFVSLFSSKSEAAHYGISLALNFGDQGQALAEELLLSSGFPERLLLRAVTLLSTPRAHDEGKRRA